MRKTAKLIALLLSIALLAGSLSLLANADITHYDPPLRIPPLSGQNLAADIVTVAKSQVGYREDVYGGTYFGEWWTDVVSGKQFDDVWQGYIDIDCTDADWCSIYLCWCMYKAGAAYGFTYNVLSGTVDYLFNLLKVADADIYVYTPDMDYEPKMGDLAFYSYDGGKSLGHVAITDGNNKYIHANYANGVVMREGNLVYKIGDGKNYEPSYIVSPNYELSRTNGDNKIIAAVLLFESSVITFPSRLSLELEKLFNTDDDDTGSAPVVPPIVDEVIPGDADRDGEVSPADARLVLRAAVGLETLTSEQMQRADLNGDGECSTDEARSILRAAVGLQTLE